MMKADDLQLTAEWDKVFPSNEHVDLYDNCDAIPFDKLETLFGDKLK